MKIELIDNIDKFIAIEDEWKELENREKEITVFQTYLYNFTWWNTVKNLQKYKLNIFIVRDNDDKLLGIAPLIVEEEKYLFIKINTVKFMGWGDYLNFLISTKNTNVGKIISLIFENINRLEATRVLLTNIDIETILAKFLKKHQTLNGMMIFQTECPQIKFNKYKDFKEFKLKFLSNSVKKQRNKMLKELKYELNVQNNSLNNKFEKISQIHKKLKDFLNKINNNNERRSIFEIEEKNNFLKEYYARSKEIINYTLTNEKENIIIYDTCYIKNNRIISWNMAHNFTYNNYNPGRVINYEIIEWIFKQDNFKDYIFDFGCGGYSWKFQWTEDFTLVYKLEYDIQKNFKSKIINKSKLIKKGVQCFIQVIKK